LNLPEYSTIDLEVLKSVVATCPELKINALDDDLRTPLHVAAYRGKCDAFTFLLSSLQNAEEELTRRDKNDRTPLGILTEFDTSTESDRNHVLSELLEECTIHMHLNM